MVRFKRTGRFLLLAALSTATMSGCKNGLSVPVWNPFAKSTSADAGFAGSADAPTFGSSTPKTESSWTAPFKKFGDTISAPFKTAAVPKKTAAKPQPGDPIALATKVTPPNAALYVSLAKLQERSGNTSAAVEEYDKALEAEPKNLPALLGLARLYDRQGRYDEAIKLYKTAVELHPENAAVMNDYGLCLARSGNLKESAVAMRRAVSLDSEKILYRNNLATVLVELDRADEAYELLIPAHGEAVAHYNVGFLLNKRETPENKTAAYKHFQAAAKLNPDFKEAQQWVAILSKDAGKDTTVVAMQPKSTPAVKKEESIETPIATPIPLQAAPTLPPVSATVQAAPATKSAPTPAPVAPVAPPRTELPLTAPNASTTSPSTPIPARPVSQPTVLQPAETVGPQLPLNPQTRSQPAAQPTVQPQKSEAVAQKDSRAAGQIASSTKPAAAVPPLPDQVSSLNPSTPIAASAAAKTSEPKSAARYPASRY